MINRPANESVILKEGGTSDATCFRQPSVRAKAMIMTLLLPKPMRIALDHAREAALQDEVPVGAVIMRGEMLISVASNAMRQGHDPTAHAEIVAIRKACAELGSQRLTECDLWVTLEPCAMCAAAIAQARIARLYYAASDPKGGGVEHGTRIFASPGCNHIPEIYAGIGEGEASEMLKSFFAQRR
jgi:tRNA(adenine34) deaminase